jgi:hypothetical protein
LIQEFPKEKVGLIGGRRNRDGTQERPGCIVEAPQTIVSDTECECELSAAAQMFHAGVQDRDSLGKFALMEQRLRGFKEGRLGAFAGRRILRDQRRIPGLRFGGFQTSPGLSVIDCERSLHQGLARS